MSFRQQLILTNMSSLPSPGTVGGKRTIFHPGNVRLHDFTLYFTQGQTGALSTPKPATKGQIAAALERVELKVGTTTIRDFTAAQLIARQNILGYASTPDGALIVRMSNPLAATVIGEEMTSWDLRGIPELQIVLTLNVPATGTHFDVSAISSVDSVANTNSGGSRYIGRFIRESRWTDIIGEGRKSYFLIPRTRPFSRLWLFAEDDLPTRVILRVNGIDVYDVSQTAEKPELAMQLINYGKNPPVDNNGNVVGVWPIILNPNEVVDDRLDITPADTLELITERPGSGQIEFLIEQQTPGVAA
ncbi:hypothetical protein OH491_17470 [Termitidicoccus mucosus]|uniref:Viral coat protein P2 N-terminal domain-containing protein n=1 Tax=Termitidicoccus mucosus TaxID=1184151 RepID=A0A178IIY6_9BACT|nr:hypothetical protein AW736_11125 [Opitutaceae bacterium TSB47]